MSRHFVDKKGSNKKTAFNMMPVDKIIQTKTNKDGALKGMHKNFIDAKVQRN